MSHLSSATDDVAANKTELKEPSCRRRSSRPPSFWTRQIDARLFRAPFICRLLRSNFLFFRLRV